MTDGFLIFNGVLQAYTLREPIVYIPDAVHTIGEGAFKGCTSIEQVVLPQTVTEIKAHAFKGCRRLQKVNFPTSLVRIGTYAFHRCHALLEVDLPDSVTELGSCAFLYCDSLQTVSMPGVTRLGSQVFLNDTKISCLTISEQLEISDICDVFTGCSNIRKICLADGRSTDTCQMVALMGSQADLHPLVRAVITDVFRMMQIEDGMLIKFLINLKHVEIPTGITKIGKSCFFDKKGIISIKLPASLKRIGSGAFRNCSSLELVEFMNTEVEIEKNAFKNCSALTCIRLPGATDYPLVGLADQSVKKVPELVSTIHRQILTNFFMCGTELICYRGSEEQVVVPAGVTVIGARAFAGNEAVRKVILPDSIVLIQEQAFTDCLLLQTINLPAGIKTIEKSAFENCVKLIRVDLPEALEKVERAVFNRCKKLVAIQFGERLAEIEELAFYQCQALKALEFPAHLRKLGDMAFYQCLSLNEITLPNSLALVGNHVFTLSGIKKVLVKCQLEQWGTGVFSECKKLREIQFEQGITTVGDKFAFHCSNLKQVGLPATLKYIGRSAFEGSKYLNEVIQHGTIGTIFLDGRNLAGEVTLPEGIRSIAGGAFYGNHQITTITLPESLIWIGPAAFCGCLSLQEIILPQGIRSIGEETFSDCESLKYVRAAGVIDEIGRQAFYGCGQLVQVPSEDAVTIGTEAFARCPRLDNIQIDCSVLGDRVFAGSSFLDKKKRASEMVLVGDIVIAGNDCCGEVLLPDEVRKVAPYAFASNQKITGIVSTHKLDVIGEGAFYGCNNLSQVKLSAPIGTIEKEAFAKCVALSELSVQVNDIQEGAFTYCIGLKKVELADVHVLRKEVFCGCKSLEIIQADVLEEIGMRCFEGCESLTEFNFLSIRRVGEGAFKGCNSLVKICFNQSIMIDSHAFEDCGQLKTICLSHNKLRYGSYAFSGCTAIKQITVAGTAYQMKGYQMISSQVIPEIVKSIYCSAVSCFEIDEEMNLTCYHNSGSIIHIPDGVKRVQAEVFRAAWNLVKVELPESVEYIGARAFHSTGWLEKLKQTFGMVVIHGILLDGTCSHGEVEIPKEVKRISGWAFANCYQLTGITFLSDRTQLEEYAFRNCINLKTVKVANGEKYLLNGMNDCQRALPGMVHQIFHDCYNCFKIDSDGILLECTGNISSLKLANGIKAIGAEVFCASNLLTDITLTKDVEVIGERAFQSCKWLVAVKAADDVKQIKKAAFSGCGLLEIVELSSKLEAIGERAFEHCTSLKEIKIPEGITEIPEKAFFRCKSLKKIILPETLETIGKEAFAFCGELREIQIKKQIKSIGDRAFAWCESLERGIGDDEIS